MIEYNNLSGRSGVVGYDLFSDAIVVYFDDGSWYRYDNQSQDRR